MGGHRRKARPSRWFYAAVLGYGVKYLRSVIVVMPMAAAPGCLAGLGARVTASGEHASQPHAALLHDDLAICDYTSVRPEGPDQSSVLCGQKSRRLVPGHAAGRARGQWFQVPHNADYQWWYFPDITRDEILAFKLNDSVAEFSAVPSVSSCRLR